MSRKKRVHIPDAPPVKRRRYIYESGPDPDGRLLKLRLRKSREARDAALHSIRSAGFGRYVYARIGGPVRGAEKLYDNHDAAVRAINRHYDAQMMKHVVRRAV